MSSDTARFKKRNYFWTLNNYTEVEEETIMNLECKYMLFGHEVGDGTADVPTGTPHLQGMTYLSQPKTLAAFKTWMGTSRIHVEPTRDIESAITYCKKDGVYFEKGDPPLSQAQKGASQKALWAETLDLAKRGRFSDIDPQLQVTQCRNLEYIRQRELRSRVLDDTPHKMLWFYGGTGTGKSRKAREQFPGAYLKMCNKWWDGYDEEETVIIEEVSLQHEKIIHHMKVWLDRYPFPSETKGSASKIRPKVIVVCSNYTPREIWPLASDYEPIERRCTLYNFDVGVPFHSLNPLPLLAVETPDDQEIDEMIDFDYLAIEDLLGEDHFSEATPVTPGPVVPDWSHATDGYLEDGYAAPEEDSLPELPFAVVDVSQWMEE